MFEVTFYRKIEIKYRIYLAKSSYELRAFGSIIYEQKPMEFSLSARVFKKNTIFPLLIKIEMLTHNYKYKIRFL